MFQPPLFYTPEPPPEPEIPETETRMVDTCDMCKEHGPGTLFFCHGAPVLFMGDCCHKPDEK